ncbi:MAG: VWA domain-containing protein [Desulfomonile tiedjei]|nr:VWA domain-containing protein [Desulfomonile tiedjei]
MRTDEPRPVAGGFRPPNTGVQLHGQYRTDSGYLPNVVKSYPPPFNNGGLGKKLLAVWASAIEFVTSLKPRGHKLFSASLTPRVLSLLLVACVVLFPTCCLAGGLLHVFPPTFKEEAFPVARPIVLSSKAAVTVSESVIEYRFDQTFFNDNEFPLSGLFLLPLRSDKVLGGIDVKVDGLSAPYAVKSPGEFFSSLQELSTTMKDPSLLGLAGKSILEVRPVNVGVRRSVSVSIQYRQPHSMLGDALELVVPMDGERYSLAPIGDFEVIVRFKMSRTLRNLVSPSHHISIFRETPGRCVVSARSQEQRAREDFCLLTTFGGDDLDVKLFPHKPAGGKGTFMALLNPPVLPPKEKEPEKDVVFLMDTSASMGPANLHWAKRAVILGLSRLNPLDRFNVVIIGTRSSRMTERLVPATRENLLQAVKFVNSAQNAGGTDLYNSLMDALEQFTSRRRPALLMLVGDGHATIGITKPDSIIEAARRNNKTKTRIFVLAVGAKADAAMLDKLAVSSKGGSFRLDETQDFHAVVDRFFAGIYPPQAADLSLEFQDIEVEEIDPHPLPDIFGQDGVAVLGRYSGDRDLEARIRLRCKVKGKPKVLTEVFTFPAVQKAYPYVPSIWAMRRMARLLEQDQIKGPKPEVRKEIADLANEFGFKIPATWETEGPAPATAGEKDAGELLWRFKTSYVPSDVSSDLFRRVNDKVFRLEKNGWVETRYGPDVRVRSVEFLSEEYFSLLRAEPDLGPCLALGPDVTVITAKGPVRTTSNGRNRQRR